MPSFMATNLALKTEVSIVGWRLDSQSMSDMFRKMRIPLRDRRLVLSPAWGLEMAFTGMSEVRGQQRDFGRYINASDFNRPSHAAD